MAWLRYSAQYLLMGILAAALMGFIDGILGLVLAFAAGAGLGWFVSLRGGGLPLFMGMIALFAAAYVTSMFPNLGLNNAAMGTARMLAYTYLFGSVLGGAVGSMKREIDRQRANRKAS